MAKHFQKADFGITPERLASDSSVYHDKLSSAPWKIIGEYPPAFKTVWIKEADETRILPFFYCQLCEKYKTWYFLNKQGKVEIVSTTNLRKHSCKIVLKKNRTLFSMQESNMTMEQRKKTTSFMAKSLVESPTVSILSGTDLMNRAMQFGAKMALVKGQVPLFDINRHTVSQSVADIGEAESEKHGKFYQENYKKCCLIVDHSTKHNVKER